MAQHTRQRKIDTRIPNNNFHNLSSENRNRACMSRLLAAEMTASGTPKSWPRRSLFPLYEWLTFRLGKTL
jgi:hypothetical protein